MKTIGIFYGSTTGNTEDVAKLISKKLSGNDVHLIDVSKAKADDLDKYNNLILGTSTWGSGDLQDDWESFLPVLEKANLEGKVIALFGLGDAESYPDTFVDAMGLIYESIWSKKCKFTGYTDIKGYSFSDSKALHNASFVGLPIDMNDANTITDSRINSWISKIVDDFQ